MTKSYTDKSSMLVKGDKELDSKIGKANLIKGQGADNIKDIEDPEEDKKYSDGSKAKEVTESSYEGAFERLFKATINEEEENEDMDVELEEEVPVTPEDMTDEVEDTQEEEENLISDLQKVMDQLQGILDKLSEEGEEENSEEENSEEEDEEPYEESVDMTQKSRMKVSGKPHPSKGSVHKGSFKPSPHPKLHKNKGEYLRSKGAIKVNSSVTPGEFFK